MSFTQKTSHISYKSQKVSKGVFLFRDCSSDLYRARAALEEVTDQLDASKRENKNLSQEVKDLLEQIGDGGRSLHEVEKQCRRLEEEKEELANALDEAEAALEQVDNCFVIYSRVNLIKMYFSLKSICLVFIF